MRITRVRASVVVPFALLVSFVVASQGAALTSTEGSITGIVFDDVDRDGSMGAGEAPMSGHLLYLFDDADAYVGQATSALDGTFAFPAVAAGSYLVRYAAKSWWDLRADWVPTTSGSLRPDHQVQVSGDVFVPVGWRRLVRSTDAAAPIDTFEGPEGLRVKMYNDAMPARAISDAALAGTVGVEASTVTIAYGLASRSSATMSVVSSGGVYTSYGATVHLDHISWLDSADRNLGHEYGHAWSMYHAYLTHQDDTLAAYLEARGLTGDERVGSTYLWSARELIAEDYRQLLGSPTARLAPQANRDLPPASAVPGLEAFLRDVFTVSSSSPEPEGGTSPEPEPSTSPEPTPSPEPESSASPEPSPSPEPSKPVRGKGGSSGGSKGGGPKK